ncbi:MAG: YidC/Oxa1 family membrane protein insertase [Dehalococcoidia bacterium]
MDVLQLIGWVWSHGLVIPMTNFLVLIAQLSFGSFGLAIIIFTLLMRGATWPLTRSQMRSTRAMQLVQPKVQELQKKYKDPRRRSEETMKLYRESGVNPLGCIWPMLVQMPIWFALYQSIRFTLGDTPETMLNLSQQLYPWSFLRTAVPLENHFLWLDLGKPDPTMIMALLVGASMWVQQRMMTPMNASADPQQQQINQTMLWMMPIMFAFFTLSFPSGLALYWVATNVVSIALQYSYVGRENVSWKRIFSLSPAPAAVPARRDGAQVATVVSEPEEQDEEGEEPEAVAATEPDKKRRRRRRGRRRR